MEGCSTLLGILVVIALALATFIAYLSWQGKKEHREILEWSEEKRVEREEADGFWTAVATYHDIAEWFPYLPPPDSAIATREGVGRAIAKLLTNTPSLGTFADGRLPAPALPPQERRRHLYVVGKTGSGKTTFLEHLILGDLTAGHGVGVMAPEGELFRTRLIPLIPSSRRSDVIYFAPGDPSCPVTFNPLAIEDGDDTLRAAEDLFTIFKRALSGDELGPRMQPILQNAFAVLVGRPGATLWDVKCLLTNSSFRTQVVSSTPDPYIREFWEDTFPRFAKGADLPLLSRLDHFLRPPAVRRSLCHPVSSFSIRQALRDKKILLLNLFGLSEATQRLVGQMLLSKFQIELMRREFTGADALPYYLFCDEFQTFAGFAEGVWRELLSRGRKYGLALTLAHQFPAQLPSALQEEIFGNVNSMIAFALGTKDVQVMRKEFLTTNLHKDELRTEPIPVEELLDLKVGEAYAKLAGGRAVKLTIPAPVRVLDHGAGEQVVAESWREYGAPPPPPPPEPTEREETPQEHPRAAAPESSAEPVPAESPPRVTQQERKPDKTPSGMAPAQARPERRPQAAPAKPKAPPLEPRRPGKGGPEHTYLQELVKRSAEEHGFRAVVEEQIPGRRESVDVALYRGDSRIACEISVTTPLEHETENVRKCLAAGFSTVIALSPKKARLDKLEKILSASLSPDERERVQLFRPEELLDWLASQPAHEEEDMVGGYKVKVSYRPVSAEERQARGKAVAAVIARSLKRLQGKS